MINGNGYNNGNGHNASGGLPAAALFPLGHVVTTPGAIEALAEHPGLRVRLLSRHMSGDWGDLCREDKDLNDLALKDEGRIFSAYQVTEELRLWVITEWDRSATTVLLPEEY